MSSVRQASIIVLFGAVVMLSSAHCRVQAEEAASPPAQSSTQSEAPGRAAAQFPAQEEGPGSARTQSSPQKEEPASAVAQPPAQKEEPGRAVAQPPVQKEEPGQTAPPSPDEIEFVLDAAQQGIPVPKILSPSIDISGRGFHPDLSWPQTLAAPAALDSWQKDIGFHGMYRLQFNLWEISQLEKNKALQKKLLSNYESVIKRISDSGGIVILDIYSTPRGQGKVFDKTSAPSDPELFKQLVKTYIRYFNCVKKYTVWYEVWSAPDLDDFFLGGKNDYLLLYRCVAEAVKELLAETRIIIPVGGPSSSWWFRSFDESTILTPERSLIYELIKFCYHNKLPLDFISWHAYSTDPGAERELTSYNKNSPSLIREWLTYFDFPRETPLIVDEWNFDSGRSNVLEERGSRGNIAASYLISRMKNMQEAGLDYQTAFSLEDFQENREGVVRNVGAFWYEQSFVYTGGSKNIYNVFRMLGGLGSNLLPVQQKQADEFTGIIATRSGPDFSLIVYNYADPEIFRSFIAHGIALLNETERRSVLALIDSDKGREIRGGGDISPLPLSGKVKNLLKKAQEVAVAGKRREREDRPVRITIKNLTEPYMLQRYCVDQSCSRDCPFIPVEEKQIVPGIDGICQESVPLKPYSVALIILKPAPPPAPVTAPLVQEGAGTGSPVPEAVPAAAIVNATNAATPSNRTETQEEKH